MYWLTSFGTLDLPQHNAAFNAGPAPAPVAVTQLLSGGVYDSHGTARSPQRFPSPISYPCTIIDSTEDAVRFSLMLLKTAIGTRAKLWRTLIPGGSKHWCWARLTDVDDTMRADRHGLQVPVVLTFAQLGRWNGEYHNAGLVFGQEGLYFDDGAYFDADDVYDLDAADGVEQLIGVYHAGKLPVRDAIIQVTAGSAAITALKIGISGVSELQFTASIAATKVLRIDSGLKRVTNNAVEAWKDLTLTGNHVISDWLVLQHGDNVVSVTKTGGGTGSLIEFIFYDGWA